MMPTLVVVTDLVVTSVMVIWRFKVEAEQTTVVHTDDSPSLMLIARFALQFFVFMPKTVVEVVSKSSGPLASMKPLLDVIANPVRVAGLLELIWGLAANGMSST